MARAPRRAPPRQRTFVLFALAGLLPSLLSGFGGRPSSTTSVSGHLGQPAAPLTRVVTVQTASVDCRPGAADPRMRNYLRKG